MKLKTLEDKGERYALMFFCPGCRMSHQVNVDRDGVPKWTWNQSMDSPTFSPSILITWTYGDEGKRCHSFVHNGQIEFLSDCTHELRDRTVTLPEWAKD